MATHPSVAPSDMGALKSEIDTYFHPLLYYPVGMNRSIANLLAIFGSVLLVVSVISSVYHVNLRAEQPIDIGTFSFILRSGGSLSRPNEPEWYPLTHSMYDPGNITIRKIPVFESFDVLHQIAFGLSILENGTENTNPDPLPPNIQYDMWLNVNSSIIVVSPHNSSEHPLDQIEALQLNESTAEQSFIRRHINMRFEVAEGTTTFLYDSVRTGNNTPCDPSGLLLNPEALTVTLNQSLTVGIVSRWSARFNSTGGSDITYSGEAVTWQFLLNRTDNETCSLEGFFRCFFGDDRVKVLVPYTPLVEGVVAVGGVIMLAMALYPWKKKDDPVMDT